MSSWPACVAATIRFEVNITEDTPLLWLGILNAAFSSVFSSSSTSPMSEYASTCSLGPHAWPLRFSDAFLPEMSDTPFRVVSWKRQSLSRPGPDVMICEESIGETDMREMGWPIRTEARTLFCIQFQSMSVHEGSPHSVTIVLLSAEKEAETNCMLLVTSVCCSERTFFSVATTKIDTCGGTSALCRSQTAMLRMLGATQRYVTSSTLPPSRKKLMSFESRLWAATWRPATNATELSATKATPSLTSALVPFAYKKFKYEVMAPEPPPPAASFVAMMAANTK